MNEDEKKEKTIRWYDRDDKVSKSMNILKNIPDDSKRQITTYLVEEIITRKPYCDMFPLDAHFLILSEQRRRRWYDFDEALHIFVELLRHSSDAQKIEISEMVLNFVKTISDADGIPSSNKYVE